MTKFDPTFTNAAPGANHTPEPRIENGSAPDGDQAPALPRLSIQLLVSVRERSELVVALATGVDIIDLKEPRLGALAPVQPAFWRETVDIWNQSAAAPKQVGAAQRAPARLTPVHAGEDRGEGDLSTPPALSAALGETEEACAIAHQLPQAFRFAKVGPSGCDSVAKLHRLWQMTRDRLHDDTELVAVSYADHSRARCVSPPLVFEAAFEFGLQTCLIDTFVKEGQSTIDLLGLDGVGRISNIARDHRLAWTLAGSIRADDVATIRSAGVSPNCIGVRGDVCRQGRTGTLSASRIAAWKNALKA